MEEEGKRDSDQQINRVRDGMQDRTESGMGHKWPLEKLEHLSIFRYANQWDKLIVNQILDTNAGKQLS